MLWYVMGVLFKIPVQYNLNESRAQLSVSVLFHNLGCGVCSISCQGEIFSQDVIPLTNQHHGEFK